MTRVMSDHALSRLRRAAIARRGPIGAAYAVLGALVFAYAILLVVRFAVADSTLVGGWGVDAFELAASLLCLARGLRGGSRAPVPVVLGLALACWALGDVTQTVQSLGGGTVPSPGPADGLYLAFFPLCYVALVLFVRGETRQLSSPSWFDGGVAGLGAAAVCAAFAFDGIERTTGASGLSAIVNLAYPVGDVLLLLLMVGGTAVLSGRGKKPWMLLSAGIVANVLGDTANLFQSALNSQAGIVSDALAWPVSTLLMSLAMWLPAGPGDPLALRRPPGFALPGVAAGAGLAVLFAGTLESINRVATGLATATLVLVVLRTLYSVRQLRALNRERHRESVTDHLTGLPNRRRLFDALDVVFAQEAAVRPATAFLFIDLNGFKRVNDAFGHPMGDEVLRRVGDRMLAALDDGHLLARVGGDEFAVMVIGADAESAAQIAERLGASLEEPFRIDSVTARLTSSIGVALAPRDAGDRGALVACADMAMYRAKLSGSRFELYERSLDAGSDRLALADELSDAMEADGLLLHFQPQLDLASREVATVEALVRWRHPRLGVIPPLTFLPLAEEAGLMGRVTRWVLDAALGQVARWWADGIRLRVSVNVAVGDLLEPGFPELVTARLDAHGLPASALELEITETSIIEEFERVRAAVGRLRELGVEVSIDDFGAGFTSLAYLNSLAVSELKLDRRFIAPLAGAVGSRDVELVRATIALGHALGLRVVAEGVEDEAVLQLLAGLDCDVAQGYGLGRPAPAEELAFRRATAGGALALHAA